MIKFKDRVRLKPDTNTFRSNQRLSSAIGVVVVTRVVAGPVVAATVQFEDARLKHIPAEDLIVERWTDRS